MSEIFYKNINFKEFYYVHIDEKLCCSTADDNQLNLK